MSSPRRIRSSNCMVMVLLTTISLIVGCAQNAEREKDRQDLKKPLDTIQAEVLSVKLGPWPKVVRSQGSLFADEQTLVGSKVAGLVAEVHVDLGDHVHSGDPLVTLDQAEFRLALNQAAALLDQSRAAVGLASGSDAAKLDPNQSPPVRQERATLAEAKTSLERAEVLLRQNAISKGEYDIAAATAQVAEARLAAAINGVREKIASIGVREAELAMTRQRLEDAVIRAPLDGYIRQRQVAPGMFLSIGDGIAVIVRTHPLRFRGSVPERYAQNIQLGQELTLRIESVAEPRLAKVTRISPALDAQSRSLTIEALVDNSGDILRAGFFTEAEIVVDPNALAIVVPTSAVIDFAGNEKVWRVVDGMLTEQEVWTSNERDGLREVVNGLAVGDRILVKASQGRTAKLALLNESEATEPLASEGKR